MIVIHHEPGAISKQSLPLFIVDVLQEFKNSFCSCGIDEVAHDLTLVTSHFSPAQPSCDLAVIQRPRTVDALHVLAWNCRRSQTLRRPSSPPDRRKGSLLFQLMTLTSDE